MIKEKEFPEPKKCWFCKNKTHFASTQSIGKGACEKHTKNGAKALSERMAGAISIINQAISNE